MQSPVIAGERRTALKELDLQSEADAKLALTRQGRRGRIPWCDPRYNDSLAYISAGGVLLVPISHCLLRGVVRSLFVYALTTPVSTVSDDDPVVFNTEERGKVKVCFQALRKVLYAGEHETPMRCCWFASSIPAVGACRLTGAGPLTPDELLLQGLACRIVYGSAFNRPYRCVVKYIKSYVIEELANLIFIGSYIAKCGPPGFKTLWMRLQPALLHYLYGKDDTVAQQHAAETSLRRYAMKLEKYVIEGKVGTCSSQGYAILQCMHTCRRNSCMREHCQHHARTRMMSRFNNDLHAGALKVAVPEFALCRVSVAPARTTAWQFSKGERAIHGALHEPVQSSIQVPPHHPDRGVFC